MIIDWLTHRRYSCVLLQSRSLVCLAASIAVAPAAQAQWAVIDVAGHRAADSGSADHCSSNWPPPAAQLLQAQQALQSMTGDRGMEHLLGGTVAQLPADRTGRRSLRRCRAGGRLRRAVGRHPAASINANAVLSAQQLGDAVRRPTSSKFRRRANGARCCRHLAQQALANTSSRFASIQSLIAAISTGDGSEGDLDLQARISAEQGMLQNEQTKLQVLNQASAGAGVVQCASRQREQVDRRTRAASPPASSRFPDRR